VHDDKAGNGHWTANAAPQYAAAGDSARRSARHELPVARRWFEVTEVADGVFRITEPYVHAYVRSNAWLVRGSDSHLLVDSGLGVGRLPDELAEHLDRPVIAVATHAHFDHFGGLTEFAERAAHRDDGEVIEAASDYVTLAAGSYPSALLDEFEAADAGALAWQHLPVGSRVRHAPFR
jgi:glyoxylase-like metal-dependent hydrolase (beta-lactamase superfamily II)